MEEEEALQRRLEGEVGEGVEAAAWLALGRVGFGDCTVCEYADQKMFNRETLAIRLDNGEVAEMVA